MSITNKRIYPLKAKYSGKAAVYDKYIFKMGNNDLLIKSNMNYSVVFGKQFCYFETKEDKITDFLGTDSDEGRYTRV